MHTKSLWCKNHPVSFIGKDKFGKPYSRCLEGKKLHDRGIMQKCDIQNENEDLEYQDDNN